MEKYSTRLGVFLLGLVFLGLLAWPVTRWMSDMPYGGRLAVGIFMLLILLAYMFFAGVWANKGTRKG
jgi:cbb3-type cytochrome oxidase subunit 3